MEYAENNRRTNTFKMGKTIKLMVCAITVAATMLLLSACGKSYTCYRCEETTKKAYYDMAASKEQVLCEECARQYWIPLDYEKYKVD